MNTHEAKLEKIKSRSNKSAKVLTIITRVVVIIAIVVALVGIGVLAFNTPLEKEILSHPDAIKTLENDTNFNFGHTFNAKFNFSSDSEDIAIFEKISEFTGIGKYCLFISIVCFSGSIALLISALITKLLKKVFVHFAESPTPFDKEFLSYLKKIFIILTIFIALTADGLLAIFMGLLFWCIYSMFDYGCVLQEENDATI